MIGNCKQNAEQRSWVEKMEVKICLLVLLIGFLSALYHAGKPGEASEAKSA
jgi:DMSO reductase anchor subunit